MKMSLTYLKAMKMNMFQKYTIVAIFLQPQMQPDSPIKRLGG